MLAAVRAALDELLPPELELDNPEVLSLQRERDGRRLLFVANPTDEEQAVEVALDRPGRPYLLDCETGEERPLRPAWRDGRGVRFRLLLPAADSACVAVGPGPELVEADAAEPQHRLDDAALVLDGEWEVSFDGPNVLPLAVEPAPGPFVRVEPSARTPAAVTYRARFDALDLPAEVGLLVDGFAGNGWSVVLNGAVLDEAPRPSGLDCEIGVFDLTRLVRPGSNELELRLEVAGPRDGLLDAPRLAGTFALGGASLVSPPRVLPAEPWTEHGYPFYSGIGRYRRRFRLPPQDGARLLLLVDVGDDAVEAVVNGRSAGVRAWRPYELDVSDFVRAGENEVELRVANTAANLFGCDPRASGLRAPPRLVRLRP